MRFLVSGVAGFIGSRLAEHLLDADHEVIGVDDYSVGRPENVPDGVEMIVHDLAVGELSAVLPPDIDVIMHLAGQSSGEISFSDPVADLNKNVVSTLNLILYGVEIHAQRLVFASSMTCYGDLEDYCATEDVLCLPMSCYGVSKLAAERYLQIFAEELSFVIFRLFNVYGPGQDLTNMHQGMVSIFLSQALQGGRVQVKGQLDRVRDFIEISDVAEAFVKAGTTGRADGRILNLGTGRPTTVKDILDQLKRNIPDMDWFVDERTPGDQAGIYADTTRLKEVLEFEARTGIEEGFAGFVDWARGRVSL